MSARRLLLAASLCLTGAPAAAQTLRVRNNHEMPYRGAVQVAVPGIPDGRYEGPNGSIGAVRDGIARLVVDLPAGASTTLAWLTENFDDYRTAGLDRWAKWRELAPRMRGDPHVARAMGFEMVRLHHLELLQEMDRAEALAFLDFFTGAARDLGMRVMIDTEGPARWVAMLAGRYRDVLLETDFK